MTIKLINIIVVCNALLISFFVGYHLFYLVLYMALKARKNNRVKNSENKDNKFAIIIPAHNEELIIEKLIDSVKSLDYPKSKYDLYVIADNCVDKTEEICKERNVKCFARKDDINKGKPYALEWFFRQIDLDIYDAYSIVDADTIVGENYLVAMNNKINSGSDAIQGYFGIMNPDDSWLTRLMVIPGILKFKIRYFCKDRIGFSCPLMGNGMCFSKRIIQKYGWNAFSITENWEYYIKLILNNYIVTYAENAIIYSHAVKALSHGETQRKRWIKGRHSVLTEYSWRLFLKFLKEKKVQFLDAFLELLLPSFSMLFNWTALMMIVVCILSLFQITATYMIVWVIMLILVQVSYFLLGLVIAKAPITTWLILCFIPIYLIWKLVITLKARLSFGRATWDKTDRKL